MTNAIRTVDSRSSGKPRGTTGPNTAAGKAIVSRNAIRHGTFAGALIQGVECPEDWDAHHAGVLVSLAPLTPVEAELADRIALLLWRLRRVARYEGQAISVRVAEAEQKAATELVEAHQDEPSGLERIDALMEHPDDLRAACADLARAVAAFETLDSSRGSAFVPKESALALLRAVARVNGHDDGAAFDERCRNLFGDATAWSRANLDRVAESFASPGQSVRDLLSDAHHAARDELGYASAVLRDLEEWTADLRYARTLPPPKVLDRVTKYEAHLHRLLVSTLHELEAMQRRRAGEPTPLGRLSVTGDPAVPALGSEAEE